MMVAQVVAKIGIICIKLNLKRKTLYGYILLVKISKMHSTAFYRILIEQYEKACKLEVAQVDKLKRFKALKVLKGLFTDSFSIALISYFG